MMIFKTEQELREVISLGKPEEVIDVFLESYLHGLEYNKCEDKELFELVDVSEKMVDWKLDNFALLRQYEYLPMPEQLDMQYKDKLNGTSFWESHIDYVKNKWKKRSNQ